MLLLFTFKIMMNCTISGAFVPLTEDGTLLVDNVLVSCYASFSHDLSHIVMSPLRWFSWLLDFTPTEGIHPFVVLMKRLGRSILPKTWLSQVSNIGDEFQHTMSDQHTIATHRSEEFLPNSPKTEL